MCTVLHLGGGWVHSRKSSAARGVQGSASTQAGGVLLISQVVVFVLVLHWGWPSSTSYVSTHHMRCATADSGLIHDLLLTLS